MLRTTRTIALVGLLAPAAPDDAYGNKSRVLSVVGMNPGWQSPMRVDFVDLPAPHDDWNGRSMWVGPPVRYCENAAQTVVPEPDNPPTYGCGPSPGSSELTFWASKLRCDAYYTDWSQYGGVHVFDDEIVPGGTYQIREIESACDTAFEANYSAALEELTSDWGNSVGTRSVRPCTPPDGSVDVTTDAVVALDKFQNLPTAPIKVRADMKPASLDMAINITNVTYILDAFSGAAYAFPSPGYDCGAASAAGAERKNTDDHRQTR